jgi:hypothetical protein
MVHRRQEGGVGHAGAPILPRTRLGWQAIGFAVAGVALVSLAGVIPASAALGFAFGLAGGVTGLVAIRNDHERAVTVFMAVLPLVVVVAFVLAELLVPHD